MHARNTIAGAARCCKKLSLKRQCTLFENALQSEAFSKCAENCLSSAIIGVTLNTVGTGEKQHFIRGFSSSSSASPQNDDDYDAYSSATSSIHREEEGKASTVEPIWNAAYRAKVEEVVFGIKQNGHKNNASGSSSRASPEKAEGGRGFHAAEEKLKKAKEMIMKEFAKEKEKFVSKKAEGGPWIDQEETMVELSEEQDKFMKGKGQFANASEKNDPKKVKRGPVAKQKQGKQRFAKEKDNFAKEEGSFVLRKLKRGPRTDQEKGMGKIAKGDVKFARESETVELKKVAGEDEAKGTFAREKERVIKEKDEFAKRKKDKSAKEKDNIGKTANELEEGEDEDEMLQIDEDIDDLFPQHSSEEKERMASELTKAINSFKLSYENIVTNCPSERGSTKLEEGLLEDSTLVTGKHKENIIVGKGTDIFSKRETTTANELEEEEDDNNRQVGVEQTENSTEDWSPQLNPVEKEWRFSKTARTLFEASLAQPDDELEKENEGQVREEDQKSLSVGIIGAPNAGKSTLTNFLVGEKVAAVSRKTNTTTHEVLGVLTKGETQILFYDTPGLMLNYAGNRYKDVRQRVESAWSSVELYDLLIVVIDAHRHLTRPDSRVIKLVNKMGEKVNPNQKRILCMNKVDLVEVKKDLLKVASEFGHLPGYDKFYMLSGMKGSGVKDLVNYLMEQAVRRPWDEDPITLDEDSLKNTSLEVVREKFLHYIHQEIPYEVDQRLIDWKEMEDGSLRIEQHFIVHKHTHRRIIIGTRGSKIREIGMAANEELRALFKRTVHLIIQVRLKS